MYSHYKDGTIAWESLYKYDGIHFKQGQAILYKYI